MAYWNMLYAIPEERLHSCKSLETIKATAVKGSGCSHLVSYWVEMQPLGGLLGRALDGGNRLHEHWHHRLRVPVFHAMPAVAALSKQLSDAWRAAQLANADVAADEWFRGEIERVVHLFRFAADNDLAVLSILDHSKFGLESASRSQLATRRARRFAWGFWDLLMRRR